MSAGVFVANCTLSAVIFFSSSFPFFPFFSSSFPSFSSSFISFPSVSLLVKTLEESFNPTPHIIAVGTHRQSVARATSAYHPLSHALPYSPSPISDNDSHFPQYSPAGSHQHLAVETVLISILGRQDTRGESSPIHLTPPTIKFPIPMAQCSTPTYKYTQVIYSLCLLSSRPVSSCLPYSRSPISNTTTSPFPSPPCCKPPTSRYRSPSSQLGR